jgi:hypothetical protein
VQLSRPGADGDLGDILARSEATFTNYSGLDADPDAFEELMAFKKKKFLRHHPS